MNSSPPDTVGPYLLEEVVGSGGMGKVYRAYDRRLDRHVAVKQLRPGREDDPKARKRLRREARAAAALGHPAIVQVFDLVEAEAGDWIVMELVDGSSLAHRLRGGPLGVREVLELAQDLADGLAYAHAQGFVHRDFKTENVMVNALGRPKILDFGLAKRTVPIRDDSSLTLEGAVLGTLRAMSPEQAKGYEVDARSDLFSFGTLLYECLTATSPFKGHNSLETLNRVCTYRQQGVRCLNPEVPQDLSHLVDQLLEKLPEHRPQDARKVADALRAIDRRLESGTPADATSVSDERETVDYGPTVESASDSIQFGRTRGRLRFWVPAAAALAAALFLPQVKQLLVSEPKADPTPTPVAMRPEPAPVRQSSELIRLVVLPFESLGPQDTAYFASGITEEISRRLALVSGLGIISRTSAARYAGADMDVRQIGRELDVEYVLEGTVTWPPPESGSAELRISPRLIRVAEDIQIWTDVFTRPFEDVLQVQSEIAGAVAAELDLTLQNTQRKALEAQGTQVPAAYNAYLRGLYHRNQPQYTRTDMLKAVRMFAHAAQKDNSFVEAYVELSRGHCVLYFNNDPTEKRRSDAESALRRAQSLGADLPSVRIASAYFKYHVQNDFEGAIEEFQAAARYLPHDAEVLAGIGRVMVRQGMFDEAGQKLAESFSLDRANATLAHSIGEIYLGMRDHVTADHWLGVSLELAPDFTQALGERALSRLSSHGCPIPAPGTVPCSTESARQILVDSPVRDDPDLYRYWLFLDLYDATLSSSEEALELYTRVVARMRDYPNRPRGPGDGCLYFWYEALALERLGQRQEALDLVRDCRDEMQEIVASRPNAEAQLGRLGIAFAYLGQQEEALAYGELGVDAGSGDRFTGVRNFEYLAIIQVFLGQYESAIANLEQLVETPYRNPIDLTRLHLDPIWDPLRGVARFQRLFSKND